MQLWHVGINACFFLANVTQFLRIEFHVFHHGCKQRAEAPPGYGMTHFLCSLFGYMEFEMQDLTR